MPIKSSKIDKTIQTIDNVINKHIGNTKTNAIHLINVTPKIPLTNPNRTPYRIANFTKSKTLLSKIFEMYFTTISNKVSSID